MAVKPASQWGQNYVASAPRATTNFNAGVQNYTGDWAAATVSQEAQLVSGFNAAVSRGDWRNGIMQTGTQGWKAATEAKAANYGVGLNAGAQKYNNAAAKLQPIVQSAVNALPPRGDINANIQRSAAFAMAMHSIKGQVKG